MSRGLFLLALFGAGCNAFGLGTGTSAVAVFCGTRTASLSILTPGGSAPSGSQDWGGCGALMTCGAETAYVPFDDCGVRLKPGADAGTFVLDGESGCEQQDDAGTHVYTFTEAALLVDGSAGTRRMTGTLTGRREWNKTDGTVATNAFTLGVDTLERTGATYERAPGCADLHSPEPLDRLPVAGCSASDVVDARDDESRRRVTFTDGAYAPKCLQVRAGQRVTFVGDQSVHPPRAGTAASTYAGSQPNPLLLSVAQGSSEQAFTFEFAGDYLFHTTDAPSATPQLIRVR